jgi:hypothetical protein
MNNKSMTNGAGIIKQQWRRPNNIITDPIAGSLRIGEINNHDNSTHQQQLYKNKSNRKTFNIPLTPLHDPRAKVSTSPAN